jgi:hypothetical protein
MDKNNLIQQAIIKKIDSGYVYNKLEKIGGVYSLNLDQIGDLDIQTCKLLLGEIETTDFNSVVASYLEIDGKLAEKIVGEINEQIVLRIKAELTGATPEKSSGPKEPLTPTPSIITPTTPVTVLSQKPSAYDLSPKPVAIDPQPIEKAGDFVVDIMPKPSNQYKEASINKESVLKSIEDPSVDLVDHMLTSPMASTAIVETKKIEATGSEGVQAPTKTVQKAPTPVINKSYGTDPYRESI